MPEEIICFAETGSGQTGGMSPRNPAIPAKANGDIVSKGKFLFMTTCTGNRIVYRKVFIIEKDTTLGCPSICDWVASGGIVICDIVGDGLLRVFVSTIYIYGL